MALNFGPDFANRSPVPEIAPGQFPRGSEGIPLPQVLIVDDEALIRWALAETLGDHGFLVEQASTKAEALRIVTARREPLAAVLLDFRLPDSDDLQLLRKLRSLMPGTPVILMTAYSTPDMVQEALDLGAFRVVHKPFEIDDIVSLVRRAH